MKFLSKHPHHIFSAQCRATAIEGNEENVIFFTLRQIDFDSFNPLINTVLITEIQNRCVEVDYSSIELLSPDTLPLLFPQSTL